jgi:hypothetical protein
MNDIKSYATVQKWIANVDRYYHLGEDEWADRLRIMEDFCRAADQDPDAMIAEALNDRAEKIDYMRRLKSFAKEQSKSRNAAHDLENVVRSFFIHNGARVVTRPYAQD